MSVATAAAPGDIDNLSKSTPSAANMGDGSGNGGRNSRIEPRRQASTSSVTGDSSNGSHASSTNNENGACSGGILANAHEVPKRSASKSDGSGIRSALKAAFIHQQPGKQAKANGKPLGKTFQRKEPLPQVHQGGEVLKVDPRGPNAPCGDGIVLSTTDADADDNVEQGATPTSPTTDGASTDTDTKANVQHSANELSSDSLLRVPSSNGNRSRSDTTSTAYTESSMTSNDSMGSSSHACSIKFAPLPTSGRLKRANSITIGVAARSQLLNSQGSGRQLNTGNMQSWQQVYQQQLQQQRQAQSQNGNGNNNNIDVSRYSGIQRQDTMDLGEEIRKGALKTWDRLRRGSGASRQSEADDRQEAAESKTTNAKRSGVQRHDTESALDDPDGAGEQTPKRAQSPTHHTPSKTDKDAAQGSRNNSNQRASSKSSGGVQRRLSTGAFTGHASFMGIEERRKRGNGADDGNERENEATRFIEMLGSTGAGKEAYHGADGRMLQHKKDGDRKEVDVVSVRREAEQSENVNEERSIESESDEDEADDDEEAREAERLADEALAHQDDQLTKAGGVEKMEKKRSLLR